MTEAEIKTAPESWTVSVPSRATVGECTYFQMCYDYLVAMVSASDGKAMIDASLSAPCRGAFEIAINGIPAVYDFSDFLLCDGANQQHAHWFRFQYNRGYRPHANLHSFPPISFLDWPQYRSLCAQGLYTASGDSILHTQSFDFLSHREDVQSRDCYMRRAEAQRRLLAAFPGRVETARLPQADFWRLAQACLVSVHIPGTWHHLLDRGQQQMLALGVCTISPAIWTACLDDRIEPWVHYVPLRDDLSDLEERVAWCADHRESCADIGQRAQEFFQSHSLPHVVRDYVLQCVGHPKG